MICGTSISRTSVSRLSKAISDITKLANALEALAVNVVPKATHWMGTYVCRLSAGISRRGWIGRRRAEPRRPCDALPATDFISISSPDGIGPGNRAKLGNGAGEQRFVNGRSTVVTGRAHDRAARRGTGRGLLAWHGGSSPYRDAGRLRRGCHLGRAARRRSPAARDACRSRSLQSGKRSVTLDLEKPLTVRNCCVSCPG